ncbi:MAG: xylB [Clostridia bacterium]|jgi:xylulokinase|nr:xylB [Clostridia bacterium]
MKNYLLGIDYGTGGAKACIIDEDANILSYAFREYPIFTNKLGFSEHEVARYWSVACEMIKECIEKAKVDPKDIKGIGTSSALPSMVLVDKNHDYINNAYNLMDKRAKAEEEWLRENIGAEEIFKISGNRLEDHPSIVNLLWEKNNRPEDFKRIDKVLTIDGYIRLKLTGEATASYSAGAFYGIAYNIVDNKFDQTILDKLDIDQKMFPKMYPCEAIVGKVTRQAAHETGLIEGIPVIAGQVDCNAGWVGAGAIEVGDIQMNLGTCGNFGIIHKEPSCFMDTMFNFAYTTNSTDTYITAATTTTGGQSLRYIRDQFSHLEAAMEKLVPGFDAYDYLNMEAEKIEPGSEGLIILPYLMGERTPIWDNDARGVVFGLSLHHTKGHFVRAMMEAVAYALYDSFKLVQEAGIKINYPIVCNEGGAKSKLWRGIITDVFNVPTVMVKSRVGAPFGDAILAGVGVGIFKDFSIAKEKAEYVDRMEPNLENHKKYMECFAIYKNLYDHLKGDFKDLAKINKKQ